MDLSIWIEVCAKLSLMLVLHICSVVPLNIKREAKKVMSVAQTSSRFILLERIDH